MKKLMIAASVALCAAVGFGDIASENIVGYNTVNIHMQYTLLAVNFESVAGGEISIQDALPVVEGMTQGGDDSTADNIQIMNAAGGYDIYYLSNGKAGRNTYPETVGKWVSPSDKSVPTTAKIKAGTAFWYVSPAASSEKSYNITIAGQVLAKAFDTKDITMSYTLVASPYPCAIPLNGGVEVESPTLSGDDSTADNLQIMNEDGGYDIYYLSNGKAGRNTYPETVGKWVSPADKSVPTAATFPIGKSAWFVSQSGAGSITFKNPIAK